MNILGSSRRGFLGAVLGLAFLPWTYARELRGVTLPDEIKITDDGPVLQLAGAGVFRYFFISVYVCGLYLPPRQTWGNDPLGADHPRRVSLVMLRGVSARLFLWGLDKGLADNTSADELAALDQPAERLRSVIRSIRTLESGARVNIDYTPRAGTGINVDGRLVGEPIAGKGLNDALLRVWLGEKPLDERLKESLLRR